MAWKKRNGTCRRAVVLLVMIGWGMLNLPAQTATKEYKLKAVFLFNFTQFVNWPPSAFAAANTPLTIGVLGEDPFGSYLTDTVTGEKVYGHELVIQHFQTVEQVTNCQVLFISRSEADHLQTILAQLKNQSILTVSDAEGFSKEGGIIRFTTRENKIRLKINLGAAKAANLTISSQLLRLADVVEPGKD